MASPPPVYSVTDSRLSILIGRIPKFTPVSAYMCNVVPWFPYSQLIALRVAALVRQCLLGWAPSYLCDLCLWHCGSSSSSTGGELLVMQARSSVGLHQAFLVAGPPFGMGFPWSYVCCRWVIYLSSINHLDLCSLAVAGLGVPLSRYIEGAL